MSYKVSVIIPVYNQEKLILRAIESVPVRDDVEIVVVDDCSTDGTSDIVFNYQREHKERNMQFWHLTKNQGVSQAVNKGLDMAQGEYIVLLGSDDYFYTNAFEKAMKKLDGTDLVYFDLKTNENVRFKLSQDTKIVYCGSVKFMRREFVGDTRNPDKRMREDYYFYQDLLKKNPTEKFTKLIVKHYNFPREGSLTWIACNGFKN